MGTLTPNINANTKHALSNLVCQVTKVIVTFPSTCRWGIGKDEDGIAILSPNTLQGRQNHTAYRMVEALR